MQSVLKTCAKCKGDKPADLAHFHAHPKTKDKLGSYCKPCQTATNVENRRKRKVKAMGRPKPDHCELCFKVGPVEWDHCHSTGRARGWLCPSCNHALGLADDNAKLLKRMAKYVEGNLNLSALKLSDILPNNTNQPRVAT